MTLTAAEGELTVAETLLAANIAASARFQSLTGSASASAALSHIYFDALPKPASGNVHTIAELQGKRPYALVYTDDETGLTAEHASTGVSYGYEFTGGRLKFLIEKDVPQAIAEEPSEIDRRFKNDLGVIFSEVLANSGKAGYLAIERMSMNGPMRSREEVVESMGDYQQAVFDIVWGTGV